MQPISQTVNSAKITEHLLHQENGNCASLQIIFSNITLIFSRSGTVHLSFRHKNFTWAFAPLPRLLRLQRSSLQTAALSSLLDARKLDQFRRKKIPRVQWMANTSLILLEANTNNSNNTSNNSNNTFSVFSCVIYKSCCIYTWCKVILKYVLVDN